MTPEKTLLVYTLRLADNALIQSQRMIELVAAQPELEQELANANFALDLIGQSRMLYSYASEIEGQGRSEDDYAFQRDEPEFRNLLLLEQPNGHFGDALVKQFLFESWYQLLLEALENCADSNLRAIAAKAVKEVRYHAQHNSSWMVRLGDGTELSHDRVQKSLNDLWRFSGEMFAADEIDLAFMKHFQGPDLGLIFERWKEDVAAVVAEATLQLPDSGWMASGGKQGVHSEHFGFLLAEMQYLQRTLPGATW